MNNFGHAFSQSNTFHAAEEEEDKSQARPDQAGMMPKFTGMFKGLGKPSTGLERNVNSLDDTNQIMMGSVMKQADEG